MPHYYNEITGEIVDYPEEAAALFPVLKRVPSERTVEVTVDDDDEKLDDSDSTESVSQSSAKTIKNGVTNAK